MPSPPITPVTPSQARKMKRSLMPDAVIEAFNTLIAKNLSDGDSTFTQKEVTKLICEKMDCTEQHVLDNGYLDVEEIFEEKGWTVTYDKPGYNESYDATFSFEADGDDDDGFYG